MFSKLYITIKSNKTFDDSIIDPISYILIDWGVNGNLIDWDIYPSRAKLEINTEDDDYQSYEITYQGMQSLMDLCFEDEFVMTIIDNDDNNETYTTYFSPPGSVNFESDISKLI